MRRTIENLTRYIGKWMGHVFERRNRFSPILELFSSSVPVEQSSRLRYGCFALDEAAMLVIFGSFKTGRAGRDREESASPQDLFQESVKPRLDKTWSYLAEASRPRGCCKEPTVRIVLLEVHNHRGWVRNRIAVTGWSGNQHPPMAECRDHLRRGITEPRDVTPEVGQSV